MRSLAILLLAAALAACSDSSKEEPAAPSAGGYSGGSSNPTPPPSRPALTASDIDEYIKLTLAFFKAPKTPEGQKAVLAAQGATQERWGDLYMRVQDARSAIIGKEKRGAAIPPELAGDVAIVEANRERIEKAQRGES
jgi:hypothetical protein